MGAVADTATRSWSRASQAPAAQRPVRPRDHRARRVRLGAQARPARPGQEPGHVRRVLIGTVVTLIESIAHPSVFDWSVTAGSRSPCCSPTSPRPWPRAAARPRPTRCAGCARTPTRRAGGGHPLTAPRSVSQRPNWPRATWWSAEAGDLIPSDGEIIEGRRLGRRVRDHRRVRARHQGGGRRPVRRHRRHEGLSDRIVIRITAERGHTFLDRMITLVEGANRQKTPNEIALTILLAALTIVFVPVVVTLDPYGCSRRGPSFVILIALLVCLIPTTIGALLSAIGIAGMDRLVQRNVLAMSRPGRRGGGRRPDAAARQDRHHHARQPDGLRLLPGQRQLRAGRGERRPTGVAVRRDARGPVDRRPRQGAVRAAGTRPRHRARVRPVHRADQDVRPRLAAGRSARAPSTRCALGDEQGGTIPADLDRHRPARRPVRRTPLAVADGPAAARRHRAQGHGQGRHPERFAELRARASAR